MINMVLSKTEADDINSFEQLGPGDWMAICVGPHLMLRSAAPDIGPVCSDLRVYFPEKIL